jgi:energy-coupling factor transporter transmembrane protein EcfT
VAQMTAYAYRPGNGPLHRAAPGLKLAALCGLSLASFFAGLPGLAVSGAAVLAAAIAGRLPLASLLAGSRPLVLGTLLVVALRAVAVDLRPLSAGIDPEGLREGLVFAAGILVSFAAGSVLFATTTTAELRFALARAEGRTVLALRALLPRRLAERIVPTDLSLTLALALAFIPRVFEVWEAAEDAHKARCGPTGVRGLFAVLPLAAERLIEAAAETAHAMESRGYDRRTL